MLQRLDVVHNRELAFDGASKTLAAYKLFEFFVLCAKAVKLVATSSQIGQRLIRRDLNAGQVSVSEWIAAHSISVQTKYAPSASAAIVVPRIR